MPRGNYNVQNGMDVETGKQAQRDSSYRACLHAMLIFIIICIILLIAAWPWNKHQAASGKGSNITDPSSAAVKGDADRETTRSTTTSTPRPTSRHTAKTSTTTAKTTTEQYARRPLSTVIAVEETDPPPTVTPSTTPRTSTTTKRIVKEVETYKGLDIPHESTTTSGGDAGEDNDIVVDFSDTTTTDVTPTIIHEERSEGNEDHRTIVDTSSAMAVVDDVTATTILDENEGVTIIAQVETTSTMAPDLPTTKLVEETVELTTPLEVTTETNFDVDVFNATSDEDETQQHYESSSLAPVEGSGLICDTSHCKTLATRMLSLMNHSVDPCDDFYEHACGGLRSNPNLLGDDPSKDVYDRIRRALNGVGDSSCQAHKTFKRYYDNCVQYDAVVTKEQRIAEARRIVGTIGEFNDNDNVNPILTDLTTLIIKLMQYHSTPLFDLMLDVDGRKPTKFALKLTAPVFKPMFRPFDRREDCLKDSDTASDLNSFYSDYSTCKKEVHKLYLDELIETMDTLNFPISAKTKTDTNQNMEFDLLSLIEHSPSVGEMQQALTGKHYVEMTIADLVNTYPKVAWRTLINTLLKRDLPDDTPVQVYFKDYLHNMLNSFTQLDTCKQQNVLLAWFAHDIYVDLVLTRDSCSRDAYCLRVASDLMEETASSLYLSTFKQETLRDMRTEAQQVFSQLQRTLEHQLYDAEWLDESSKSAAVSKLKSLTLTVDGGVGVFLNETFLNERMKEISQRDNNYFTLSASLLKRYRRQMYSLYGVKPSEPQAMWLHFLLPHSTQGIVVYALKNVVIPYGLMTRPMYEPALPHYLLMARLGFVIAHEMAHHFDVTGMTYGLNGRGDHLLSYAPNATFKDKTNCPKDSSSFEGTKTADNGRSITFKADESLSLNERIADRTAAVLGYETYLAWVRTHGEPSQLPYLGLTNNEVYFLAIAQIFCSKTTIQDYGVSLFEDEHLPPFLRVNTIMDNSDEFTNVFQCKLGVDMNRNPDVKCEAFPKLTPIDDTDFTPNDAY